MISERQIKGIIAVCIVLAFIPFISFLTPSQMDSRSPVLSTSGSKTHIIEVVAANRVSGIFFIEPETSLNQFFSQLGFNRKIAEDIQLQNGIRIRLLPEEDHQGIVIEKMDGAKRLALGLPLDINLAGQDELKLIPGVGDALAANIVAWREQIGQFEKLEQLMDIKGIKGKKLSKLRHYLYVDKMVQ